MQINIIQTADGADTVDAVVLEVEVVGCMAAVVILAAASSDNSVPLAASSFS